MYNSTTLSQTKTVFFHRSCLFIHNLIHIYINRKFTFMLADDSKKIDRGKYLKNMVETSGMTIAKVVQKTGYKDRGSYYAHINKPGLSLDILSNYASVLNVDLRRDFPEIIPVKAEEPVIDYALVPENMEEAVAMMRKWREKYFLLMEKHVRLLETRLEEIKTA